MAGQPAGFWLPPLWRRNHLPLLDSHCSTLCGQVSRYLGMVTLLVVVSCSSLGFLCRASSPGDWAVYAGIVDPLDTLFNPGYSVSRVIAHQGYNSLTHKNDIALMRLSKPLDSTGVTPQGLSQLT